MSELLPEGWSIEPLGKLTQVVSGGTPSRNVPEFWVDGDIPWVTPTDITATKGKYLSKSKDRITKSGLMGCSASLLPAGSVLMTSRATLGEAKISTVTACTNQGFKSLIARPGVSNEFLYYQIQRTKQQYARFGSGSTFLEVGKKDTDAFPVMIPDEATQIRIAELLSLIDTQIEETEALIAKQEQVRAGLMQGLFTRGLDEHGQLRPPRDQAPHLYHQTELGWLPLGWEGMTLANACSVIRDGTHLPPPRTDTGPLLLSVRNMVDGGFQLTESDERVPESFFQIMHRNWRIRPGDTLLAIVGATIGKTCQVPDGFPKFTLQRSVCILRGEEKILEPDLLALLVQRPEFKVALWSRANQTAQPGIYLDQIARIAVPIPSKREQEIVCAAMRSVSNGINILKHDLTKLRLQKTGLMQDLLTGKVSAAPLLKSAAT